MCRIVISCYDLNLHLQNSIKVIKILHTIMFYWELGSIPRQQTAEEYKLKTDATEQLPETPHKT